MILLPFPILAPLIVRFTDIRKKKEASNKNKTKTKYFEKTESCSDYLHKCLYFIRTPCIKYAYYFVNKFLFIFIYS